MNFFFFKSVQRFNDPLLYNNTNTFVDWAQFDSHEILFNTFSASSRIILVENLMTELLNA